jgi:hypothetical protein
MEEMLWTNNVGFFERELARERVDSAGDDGSLPVLVRCGLDELGTLHPCQAQHRRSESIGAYLTSFS